MLPTKNSNSVLCFKDTGQLDNSCSENSYSKHALKIYIWSIMTTGHHSLYLM